MSKAHFDALQPRQCAVLENVKHILSSKMRPMMRYVAEVAFRFHGLFTVMQSLAHRLPGVCQAWLQHQVGDHCWQECWGTGPELGQLVG